MLRDDGDTRGRAPKERGKADNEERDESSGGDSLDGGIGRLRDSEPAGGMPVSLDIPAASVEEEEEDVEEEVEEDEEEVEDGLLLLLDAGVLPWGCWRRRG